jgi:hypothetical protein
MPEQRRPASGALAMAIERRDWERVSLYLLIGVALAARAVPQATLDDLLDALTGDEGGDRAPRQG